jgi:predicted nucleic acid-binding protein
MKIVVDTNIIFSAILNIDSKIGEILLSSDKKFSFYSPSYLLEELDKHSAKIQKISKLSSADILRLQNIIFSHIRFIDTDIIDNKHWKTAANLCFDIDKNDIDFLVLTEYLDGNLWTGDTKLLKGLHKKSYTKVLSTSNLYQIHNSK